MCVEKTRGALLRFHGKSTYANALQFYVLRTLPVLILTEPGDTYSNQQDLKG
jgi:hypothetical protein